MWGTYVWVQTLSPMSRTVMAVVIGLLGGLTVAFIDWALTQLTR